MAQGLSTPDPSLSPTHLSIRRGRATTTHYTHHQVRLTVSCNTTLVPSLGLSIGPPCEAGLSTTAFLKALSLHQFCSTCTPTTCRLHMADNSFMQTTYVSPFKANTSANWNAVSRQIWRRCHTSVDSGDLNQAPPKQSAVCSTCIIPAPPANCQFIWMASAFGMIATQPVLG